MVIHDFIVVGAGPGGSFTARELAKKGFSVLLLEKDRLPREKPCAGWTTPDVWKMLGWNGQRVDSYPMRGSILHDPELNSFKMKIDIGNQGVVRKDFDQAIAENAVEEGAELRQKERVKKVTIKNNAVNVQTTQGDYSGKAIIGGDGTNSAVARSLDLRKNWKRGDLLFSFVKELRLSEKQLQQVGIDFQSYPHIFITDYSIGYGWICRKGDYLNMGIGQPAPFVRNGKEYWKNFYKTVSSIFRIKNLGFENPDGYAYAGVHDPTESTYGERTILIGDAAGFASNLTGEGIGPAMRTGEIAADVLASSYEKEDFSKDALSVYERKWKEEYQSDFQVVNRVLALYENHISLRKWLNHRMIDFLKILEEEEILEELIIGLLFTQGEKEKKFKELWKNVPSVLVKFALGNIRKFLGQKH